MSHNFSWKNIPDSSKLNEYGNNSERQIDKFFFDNDTNEKTSNQYMCVDENGNQYIQIALDDINNLNLVINDNECGNFFIEQVCEKLIECGISFSFSNHENNLPLDKAVVITLDQQYVSGPNVSIIAPYRYNVNGTSDSLAVAMYTSFKANGIGVDGIYCGKRGYRQSEDGISTRVPTPTEDSVSENANISFVTIAFGKANQTIDDIANGILDVLARYIVYNSAKNDDDLIYRAGSNNSLDELANYFKCTPFEISNLNNIDSLIPADEAIINPIPYGYTVFNQNIPVNIYSENKVRNK